MFINISKEAFEHFKNSKYCTFILKDSFFSLIDCTFKGYDELFITSENYDIYIKAKLAGAQDLEEVKSWMDEIHS